MKYLTLEVCVSLTVSVILLVFAGWLIYRAYHLPKTSQAMAIFLGNNPEMVGPRDYCPTAYVIQHDDSLRPKKAAEATRTLVTVDTIPGFRLRIYYEHSQKSADFYDITPFIPLSKYIDDFRIAGNDMTLNLRYRAYPFWIVVLIIIGLVYFGMAIEEILKIRQRVPDGDAPTMSADLVGEPPAPPTDIIEGSFEYLLNDATKKKIKN